MRMWSAIVVYLLCACLANAKLTVKYDRNTNLSNEATLSWSFDNATKMFSFGLEVTTANVSTTDAAWVGIGVGEQSSGSMLGADIATAQFKKNIVDNCTITNRHVPFVAYPIGSGNNTVFPAADRCQNERSWKLISCSRDPKKKTFTLEVRRPMEAITEQDRAISSGPQPMMYAYGVAGSVAYHRANRATKRVFLVKKDGTYPSPTQFNLPADISTTFTVRNNEYVVPSVRTTYACTSRKLTLRKGEKLYMIAAENIVEEKAHHMLVYGCEDNAFTRNYTETQNCFSHDRAGGADPRAKCTLLHVWAAGRGTFILPKDVGLLLEEKSSMIILEVHYDNPDFSLNTRDSSGVRLHFSNNRFIEAGVLQLADASVSKNGEEVKNNFNYTSTCPSSCTSTWAVDKINIFAGFSHMHTTGKFMWTNRYDKKGKFLNALSSVGFWSNDHQAGMDYSPPLIVRKGDTLSTTATFDTTKLPTTKFGLETQDEMFIDYFWYYPVQRRRSGDSNNFYCGLFQRRLRGNPVAGTTCGDLFNRENIDFTASNPSFNDVAGFRNSFGNSPGTCPAVTTGGGGGANNGSRNGTTAGITDNRSTCFPGSSRINTRKRGVVRMSDLAIGDEVEVGGGKYSKVYMFTHREESEMHGFVELWTESGKRLRVTGGHFVYADGVLRRADEVRVGEYLLDRENKATRVVDVRMTVDQGIYNPQTLHGDIVVEGIVASTYTHAFDKFAAHAMLTPARAIYEWIGARCVAFEKDRNLAMRMFREIQRWTIRDERQ